MTLYVAQRRPELNALQKGAAPIVYSTALGVQGVTLPDDPIQHEPDYASALAAFERLPQVRLLMDNGAGSAVPGNPVPGYELNFDSGRFRAPRRASSSWATTARWPLSGRARAARTSSTPPRSARPPTDFTGNTGSGTNGLWTATPPYDWTQNPAGTAASYVSAPLTANTTVVGGGALQAWVRSSAKRVDLQATVSEVRPDGVETFVQSGWLRGDLAALDPDKSTKLEPVLSLRKRDKQPLSPTKWTKVTIPLYYQGHAYRTGSRIRVTVSAVGGDQPVWAFADAKPKGSAKVTIAHSADMPSKLLLPQVNAPVPTGLPPCPGLRGEPCRTYQP